MSEDRMKPRRERDRLMCWALRSFLVLAIIGTIGGFSQFILTIKLSRQVSILRAEHTLEQMERSNRAKAWETFRDQMKDSIAMRDLDILLIKKRLDQLDRKGRWDDGLEQAVRDHAKEK